MFDSIPKIVAFLGTLHRRVQSALKQYPVGFDVLAKVSETGFGNLDNWTNWWSPERARVFRVIMLAGLSCPIDLANSTGLHLRGSGWPVFGTCGIIWRRRWLNFGEEFLTLTAAAVRT